MKQNYHTINELTSAVKMLIDKYWRLEISKEEFIDRISEIFSLPTNCGIALRGSEFSTTFEQRLGKKRSRFLKEILAQINPGKYKFN